MLITQKNYATDYSKLVQEEQFKKTSKVTGNLMKNESGNKMSGKPKHLKCVLCENYIQSDKKAQQIIDELRFT